MEVCALARMGLGRSPAVGTSTPCAAMKRIADRQIQREDGDDPHSIGAEEHTGEQSVSVPQERQPRVIRGLPKRKGLTASPSAPPASNPFAVLSQPEPPKPTPSLFASVQLSPTRKGPADAEVQPAEYWKGVRGLNWSLTKQLVRVLSQSDELANLHDTLFAFARTYAQHHDDLASKWLGRKSEVKSTASPLSAHDTKPTTSFSFTQPKAPSTTPLSTSFSFTPKTRDISFTRKPEEKTSSSPPAPSEPPAVSLPRPATAFSSGQSAPQTSGFSFGQAPKPSAPAFSFGTSSALGADVLEPVEKLTGKDEDKKEGETAKEKEPVKEDLPAEKKESADEETSEKKETPASVEAPQTQEQAALPSLPSGGFSFAGKSTQSFLDGKAPKTFTGPKPPTFQVPAGGFSFGSSQPKEAENIAKEAPRTPSAPSVTTDKPITFGSASSTPSHDSPSAPHRFSFGTSPPNKGTSSSFTKSAIGPSFANTAGVASGGSFQFGAAPIAFGTPDPQDQSSTHNVDDPESRE